MYVYVVEWIFTFLTYIELHNFNNKILMVKWLCLVSALGVIHVILTKIVAYSAQTQIQVSLDLFTILQFGVPFPSS